MKYKMDKRSTCYRKFDVGIWVKIALCCIVWTYLIDQAYSGCASTLPESHVAYMCMNSGATGQTVYIDTTKAKTTDNSSGPLCICKAVISNAKFVNVRVQENVATCGSKLKFDFTNKQVESDENKCRSTKELVQIENQQEVIMSLEKIKTPYSVDFCTKIEIELCANPDDYQCDSNAECIAKTNECDNFPDCIDSDDEDPKKCQNVLEQDVLDSSTKVQRTDPIISIQCYERTRFSTTTTTTTTTTATTTPPSTTTATTTTRMAPTTTTTTITMAPTTTTTTTQSTPTTPTTTRVTTLTQTTTRKTTTKTTPTTTSTSTVSSSSMESSMEGDETLISMEVTTQNDFNGTTSHENNTAQEEINKDILTTLKKPYVIAGMVVGALVLITVTTCLVLAVRRKQKKI